MKSSRKSTVVHSSNDSSQMVHNPININRLRWMKCSALNVSGARCARISMVPKMSDVHHNFSIAIGAAFFRQNHKYSNISPCAAMISKCISPEFKWIIVFSDWSIWIGIQTAYTFRASIYETYIWFAITNYCYCYYERPCTLYSRCQCVACEQ